MAELTYTPTDYREALEAKLPCGGQMQLNLRVVSGMIQVTVKCGQLRWCQNIAIAGRSPTELADSIDIELRQWVLRTFAAVSANKKQQRAFQGFKIWLNETPARSAWLYGDKKDAA